MDSIAINPNILGGKPHIKGTRMSVDVVMDYISNGYGTKEIKKDYPHLTNDELLAIFDYIEKRTKEERGKLVSKKS